MPKLSAGLLLYRVTDGGVEVLIGHPGGPFWARKDLGAWSIAKGEFQPGDDALDAARREFAEETGCAPEGPFHPLGSVRQAGGKVVSAWAVELEWDPSLLVSNTFSLEWPPGSGATRAFPEIDRAEWFALDEALRRILPGQRALIESLAAGLTREPES